MFVVGSLCFVSCVCCLCAVCELFVVCVVFIACGVCGVPKIEARFFSKFEGHQ